MSYPVHSTDQLTSFWSTKNKTTQQQQQQEQQQEQNKRLNNTTTTSKCPVEHEGTFINTPNDPHTTLHSNPHSSNKPFSTSSKSTCPVEHDNINPRNFMPILSQTPAPDQSVSLSTHREVSFIPKTPLGNTTTTTPPPPNTSSSSSSSSHPIQEDESIKEDKTWVYPSPQQFFNAVKRKNPNDEIKPEDVPAAVWIHNRLNDECWKEIMKWESKFHK